jgi:hypothetical protein
MEKPTHTVFLSVSVSLISHIQARIQVDFAISFVGLELWWTKEREFSHGVLCHSETELLTPNPGFISF